MSWEKEVKELQDRINLSKKMGGKEKIKRQHDAGRTTVRERITALVDKETFREIGGIAVRSQYDKDGNLLLTAEQLEDKLNRTWDQRKQLGIKQEALKKMYLLNEDITSMINLSNEMFIFLDATRVITIAYTTATSSLKPPTAFTPK